VRAQTYARPRDVGGWIRCTGSTAAINLHRRALQASVIRRDYIRRAACRKERAERIFAGVVRDATWLTIGATNGIEQRWPKESPLVSRAGGWPAGQHMGDDVRRG